VTSTIHKQRISSWGRLQSSAHHVVALHAPDEVATVINAHRPGIARGMGRSYGDVALNPGGVLWDVTGMNRFIGFDRENGILHCEAGATLHDIQRLILPQGWSLPVIPGTQFVTVGGAIANDVHGKNHHRYGSFGNQILAFTLQRSNDEPMTCSPTNNSGYFYATIGGLGLTGIILTATLQLRRISGQWLDTQAVPFTGLDAFFTLADESEVDWEYTVAWIDCVARRQRGIFLRANHSDRTDSVTSSQRQTNIPFTPPFSVFNHLTLRPMNWAYYHLQSYASRKTRQQRMEPFFYPLDSLSNWNRLYGPRGFYQYQCVVPGDNGRAVIAEILARIAANGGGSFLSVLKTFGHLPVQGMLSFPQPGGVTLALDFPDRGEKTLSLFAQLDAVVDAASGRLYPGKDARMPAALFARSYPQLEDFMSYRDPAISSAMSRRLLGT